MVGSGGGKPGPLKANGEEIRERDPSGLMYTNTGSMDTVVHGMVEAVVTADHSTGWYEPASTITNFWNLTIDTCTVSC